MPPRSLDPALRLKRLEALADLWGKIYLFHPAIVSGRVQPPSSEQERVQARFSGRVQPPFSSAESGGSPIDWNQALVRAIPKIEAAESAEEIAKAINEELLEPLGDLLTFAEAKRDRGIEGARERGADAEFESRRLSESLGYVRVPPPPLRGCGFLIDFQAAVNDLGAVDRLLVDLRWPSARGLRVSDPILRFFVRAGSRESGAELQTGPVMSRVHEGWSEDNGLGAYRQKWEVTGGSALHPIQEADARLAALCPDTDFSRLRSTTKPAVLLVNLPYATTHYKVLDALQSQPGIAVVLERSGPTDALLRLRNKDWGVASGEAVEVQLNTERLVAHDGSAGFRPDLVAEKPIGPTELPGIVEQALAAGRSEEGGERREEAARLMSLRLPAPLPEIGRGLTREERLLGLFKVWSVVRYVYPHLDLCDIDWRSCLPDWIPRVEAADTPVAYVRTLRMLTAHLHDNNVFFYYPELPEPQALPIEFGWVENKVIVTDLIDPQITQIGDQGPGAGDSEEPSAVSRQPLAVGDELVEFDGKTVPELIAEHRLQFSYSTEGAFYRHMADMLGFGTAGAEVKLVFRRRRDMTKGLPRLSAALSDRGRRGQQNRGCTPSDTDPALSKMGTVPCEGTVPILHVTLRRTVTREQWVAHLTSKRQSSGYRLLDGNIGYMDIGRLASLPEFERAFEALRRTDGLIIDIRGYPGFMVQLALSARLSEMPVKSAIFEIPVVSGYARLEQGWRAGQYEVQPDPNQRYNGPVAVLVNEKTHGGAEDICIYLKNAGRVTFVGGTTAGCNGNRTWVSLPGGGRLWFTGMRVKFGDGSRFQNVGITPDVPAAPTVEGIRAGRDEVLEKGLEVLRQLVLRPSSSEPSQTKDEGTKDEGRNDRGHTAP